MRFWYPSTDEEAKDKAAGWTFFVFCLSHYGSHGMAAPGTGNMWQLYQEWRRTPKAHETLQVGLIGSPDYFVRHGRPTATFAKAADSGLASRAPR